MKNKVRVYSLSVLVLAVLLSVLRTVCLLTAYDGSVGYFNPSFVVTLLNVFFIVSVLWCLSAFFFIPVSTVEAFASRNPIRLASAFSAGLLFLIAGVALAVDTSGLVLVVGVLMVLASLFFLSELSSGKKIKAARGWLGFLVLVFLLCFLFQVYFNMYVAINSPHKTAVQLSILCALAFTLCEIRELISKPLARTGLVMRLLCLLTCLPTAVGNLIFYSFGACDTFAGLVVSPFYAIPLLALALYAGSGLISYRNVGEATFDGEPEEPTDTQNV